MNINNNDDSFSIITSLTYLPSSTTISISPSNFPLLNRHLKRLNQAHSGLAKELPHSWCAFRPFPELNNIMNILEECITRVGREKERRIRLSIDPLGNPIATITPVNLMPSYPVRVVLDNQSTDYTTPFHRYKTTKRAVYDNARIRHGATLHPSPLPTSAPFDVLLLNSSNQLTESTISNLAICINPIKSPIFITPRKECGLLEGVMRAELLEKGEIVEGELGVEEVRKGVDEGTLLAYCFNGARGKYEVYITL